MGTLLSLELLELFNSADYQVIQSTGRFPADDINPGDWVVIDQTRDPEHGDQVALATPNETKFGTLILGERWDWLRTSRWGFEPIEWSTCELLGVIHSIHRMAGNGGAA